MSCGLTKDTNDFQNGINCDGCARVIPAGEPFLGSIDSCCGGCYRSLCKECVEFAAKLFEPTDDWGRATKLMEDQHLEDQC